MKTVKMLVAFELSLAIRTVYVIGNFKRTENYTTAIKFGVGYLLFVNEYFYLVRKHLTVQTFLMLQNIFKKCTFF